MVEHEPKKWHKSRVTIRIRIESTMLCILFPAIHNPIAAITDKRRSTKDIE